MAKKSSFQKELERLASKQIITVIGIGCLFFCVAIFGNTLIEQRMKQEKHLDDVTGTFRQVCDSVASFLQDEENAATFLNCILGLENGNGLQYRITKYNVDALVGINLILADPEGQILFSSFSEEVLNLHRKEFNQIADTNAKAQDGKLYRTVYFFSGETSEYVLIQPLYQNGVYVGSVAAYLKERDWNRLFQKYQYDIILTTAGGDVIYCSNSSFTSGSTVNKYRPRKMERYCQVNDSRYLTGRRYLPEQNVYLYSFIYQPENVSYILIGILIILSLGLVWMILFFHLLQKMAEKTSQSVRTLVEEIRLIRKEDTEHVIEIETGDEIEEIARQINKMVVSVNELNQKNMDLLEINNRMEIQNLQAQINPHFIYNTLDNIRFLIAQDGKKADELIGRFTRILRYSINNTKQSTSLQEDMEYIEDYLVIQKTRFGERFLYEVDIRPECSRVLVPKLLLQPLIENSLKYGFRKKPAIHVLIRGWIEEEYLVLKVEDDGPGQPKSTLETLRGILHSGEINTVHNGLQNINRRVILEYGNDSGLSLESQEGMGFAVTIRLWIGGGKNVPCFAG